MARPLKKAPSPSPPLRKDIEESSAIVLAAFHDEMDATSRKGAQARQEEEERLKQAAPEIANSGRKEFSSLTEKLRHGFEALVERSRQQMEEATAAYQTQVKQEAQSKLAYVTGQLTEDSASQLTALAQDSLEMAQVKLEEAKEKIVNDSEDAFRTRLAEVIAPALKPNDRRSKPRFDHEPTHEKSQPFELLRWP